MVFREQNDNFVYFMYFDLFFEVYQESHMQLRVIYHFIDVVFSWIKKCSVESKENIPVIYQIIIFKCFGNF